MTDFWPGVRKKSTNVTIKLPPTASQESTESSLEPTESVTLNDTQSSTETTPSEASVPLRSSYLKVVKNRFLPPPISVTHTTTSGLKWAKRDVDAHYLSLTQNLALKSQLGVTVLKNFPKGIPYDYSCSTAQNIRNR